MTWEHIFWIFVPSRILKPWQTHGFPGSVLAKLPGDSSSWWKELDGFFDPGHSGPGIAAMLEGTVVGSPWRTWRFKLFHGEQIWQRFFEPVWLGNKSTYVVFFCTFTPFFWIHVIFQVEFEFKINIPRLPHTFHVKSYDMYDWAQRTYHPNTVHLRRYDWKTRERQEIEERVDVPAPSKGCQMVPLQGVNSPSLRV